MKTSCRNRQIKQVISMYNKKINSLMLKDYSVTDFLRRILSSIPAEDIGYDQTRNENNPLNKKNKSFPCIMQHICEENERKQLLFF